jgi:hypothetical protein
MNYNVVILLTVPTASNFNWFTTNGRSIELSCRQVVRCERAYNSTQLGIS